METAIGPLAPGGKQWFNEDVDQATRRHDWHFHPEGRSGPEIVFLEQADVASFVAFGPDGRHAAWGSPDHSVVVCDLIELQRAMAEYGLGW